MTLTPIQSLTSPAIVFPGQGSPWQQALFDVGASAPLARKRIEQLLGDAALITGPVSRPLASVVPGVAQRIREALDNEPHVAAIDACPAVSVPAILLAQVVAAEHVAQLGLDLGKVHFGGHSQGIIGAVAMDPKEGDKAAEKALAFAFILGAAATNDYGATDARSRMLSVRGLTVEQIEEFVPAETGAVLSVINGRRHVALSGSPEALAKAQADGLPYQLSP